MCLQTWNTSRIAGVSSSLVAAFLLGTLEIAAQPGVSQGAKSSPYLSREMLPTQLRRAVDALGDRVAKPGNERVISIGTMTKGAKQTAVRITAEMPNKIRVEDISTNGGRLIGSNGNSAWASDQINDDDLDSMETLNDDAAESLLYGLQSGTPLRVVGQRFQTDHSNAATYRGPWLDIFESPSIIGGRSSSVVRQKYVVFDSNTQHLLYVRYNILRGGQSVLVQTEWSGWRLVNGQAVPSRVGRRENGIEIWKLSRDQVTIGPAQADGAFNPR